MFSKFFSTSVILALLAQDCTRTGTVEQGDTCNAICDRYGVSYYQLRIYNRWINRECTNLHAGDPLCLAKEVADCGPDEVHTVQEGESCWSISQAYNINMETFLHNNGLTTGGCTHLQVGQVVCVSHDWINYPSPRGLLD